jgi:hypothetical protein
VFSQIFFGWPVCSVLQGILEKTGGRTWCFDGEFVVECVVKLVSCRSLLGVEKWDTDSEFIFEWFPFWE